MSHPQNGIFILDSTAFIGLDFPLLLNIKAKKFLTTHSVKKELRDFRSRSNFDLLEQSEKLEIESPVPNKVEIIKSKIAEVEPISRLSDVDIEILALSWDHKGILVSNDYAVQNIAKYLNILTYQLTGEGIQGLRIGFLKCMSCKKTTKTFSKDCPWCGGKMKQIYTTTRNDRNQE